MLREWVEAKAGSWLPRAPGVSAQLAQVGGVSWPAVVAIDEALGGLSLYLGTRELWVGLDSALEMPLFRRSLEGRPHVLIGALGTTRWYVDSQGAMLEVADDGLITGRCGSVREALERLARGD